MIFAILDWSFKSQNIILLTRKSAAFSCFLIRFTVSFPDKNVGDLVIAEEHLMTDGGNILHVNSFILSVCREKDIFTVVVALVVNSK